MSVAGLEEIFAKYEGMAKKAHPNKFRTGRYTSHVMRYTTVTHLIEAGVTLHVVKNILGHSSIQSTQVYVEISQQIIDQSVKRWNEKWFSKYGIKEEFLPKMQSSLLNFLL